MEAILDILRKPVQTGVGWLAGTVNHLSGGKITPNAITLFGLLAHAPITFLIALQHYWLAAGWLVVFGLFDTLDGALARLQHESSPRGMLLDSVTDRMKETMLYIGSAYAIIASTGRPYLAVWAVAACGCALLTSYVNAWGEAVMARHYSDKHPFNKTFRGGLMPFEVRMFILLIGLLSGRLTLAIIVIALGACYTAVSRLVRVFRKLTVDNV